MKFHAIQRADKKDWVFRSSATSDQDLEHLREYVQKIKDTRFFQRLRAATTEFFGQTRAIDFKPSNGQVVYETTALTVFQRPHIAESRYGFHFKDTNEYGIYSAFYADGRDRPYQSYYRSDRMFEAEHGLNYLRIDERI